MFYTTYNQTMALRKNKQRHLGIVSDGAFCSKEIETQP